MQNEDWSSDSWGADVVGFWFFLWSWMQVCTREYSLWKSEALKCLLFKYRKSFLFVWQSGRVTPTTLFLCFSREHSWKEKHAQSCSSSSVIRHRNKTSCAYISPQSGLCGKSYIQKCKNENHMHCFTHFSRTPQTALTCHVIKAELCSPEKKWTEKHRDWNNRKKEISERKKRKK